MKLIGALTSPYVRKVRVVLAEKKLDYQFVLEDVWNHDTIQKSNPLGKVPCLVLDGGEAVFDSRVIVEYVDTLSPVGKLIPPSGRERVEVRTWEALSDGLLDAAILARLEANWAPRGEQRSQAWIDRQMRAVHNALKARAWARSRIAPARTSRWPTWPWAWRWATSTSASRRSTGAAATPTCRSCTTSSPCARASSTARRRKAE
jgi:glutathione S-transferase